jgi:hypothetical protein
MEGQENGMIQPRWGWKSGWVIVTAGFHLRLFGFNPSGYKHDEHRKSNIAVFIPFRVVNARE